MKIEVKKVTGWFGLREKDGLVKNPNQDNIFKANTVLVSNISGTNQEVLLFDNNSNVKQRINVTDKQTIKLEKEPKDSITGTVDCLGLVK